MSFFLSFFYSLRNLESLEMIFWDNFPNIMSLIYMNSCLYGDLINKYLLFSRDYLVISKNSLITSIANDY